MKKYIALAALLAAGTSCANAVELSDAGFSVMYPTDSSYAFDSGMFDSTSFSFTFTIAPDVINVIGLNTETDPATTTKPTLISVQAGTGHHIGAGVGYSSNASKDITAAGIWGQATQASSTTACDSYFGGSNINNLDTVDTIAVTVSHEATSGTTFFISALSDGVWTEYTPTKNTSLKWASGNAAPSDLNINTNAGISSVYVFNSVITSAADAQAINHAAVEALPEPSAFGLLAGIGALALVASRRRRK